MLVTAVVAHLRHPGGLSWQDLSVLPELRSPAVNSDWSPAASPVVAVATQSESECSFPDCQAAPVAEWWLCGDPLSVTMASAGQNSQADRYAV